MHLPAVRHAYSCVSKRYIELFDGDWDAHEADAAFIGRHLREIRGPVHDLGCGPGYWSGYLHGLGFDVTGVDVVPEFIAHARAAHPGPAYRLGSMSDDEVPGSASAVLSWFSTIHLPPDQLDAVLGQYRRLLTPGGALILGFFVGADDVTRFDHAVLTAYRWPVDLLVERLRHAGFAEVERMQRQVAERKDRVYGAIAARAV